MLIVLEVQYLKPAFAIATTSYCCLLGLVSSSLVTVEGIFSVLGYDEFLSDHLIATV